MADTAPLSSRAQRGIYGPQHGSLAALGMTRLTHARKSVLAQQAPDHVELDLRRLDHLADRHALVGGMPLRARAGAEVDDLDAVVGVVAPVRDAGGVEEFHLAPGLLLHRRLEGGDGQAVLRGCEAVG